MKNKQKNISTIIIEEIEKNSDNSYKDQFLLIKEEIKLNILNNLEEKNEYQNILEKISSLVVLIQEIFREKIQQLINQYESNIRRDEQTIRILYKNLLTQKLKENSLENKIRLLAIKEKEYELVKDKTGAYVKDGEIVYNNQKDNEIIILRAENSNLKNIVDNYEKIIKEKNQKYDNLKNKYNKIQNKLNNNINFQKLKIPNININLSDSTNITNIDNIFHSSIIQDISYRSNCKNNKYLQSKNNSKLNNIPNKYCLSSRNLLQNRQHYLINKDIFNLKSNNNHLNKKIKKISPIENQKEICSLKKRHYKIEDSFQTNYKKNQFNLLQSYTSNSSKNIEKSPESKKITNNSKENKISSYKRKNNSQKNDYTNSNNNKMNFKRNKLNKTSIESENIQKSYLSSIPFNKEKELSNRVLKEEKHNYNRYKLIYCKTKREINKSKNNENLYKNSTKKYNNNINTNKIFLSSSMKKNGTKRKII